MRLPSDTRGFSTMTRVQRPVSSNGPGVFLALEKRPASSSCTPPGLPVHSQHQDELPTR